MIVLRELSGIAEIERLAHGKGEWLTEAELQQRADRVSVGLFGIDRRDTFGWDSAPDRAYRPGEDIIWNSRPDDSEDHFQLVSDPDCWPGDRELQAYFEELGFDIADENGQRLRCLDKFDRQLIAVALRLLPEARLTPDGSGKPNRNDEAGLAGLQASLEREAQLFRPKRRR